MLQRRNRGPQRGRLVRAVGVVVAALTMFSGNNVAQAAVPYTPVITGVEISSGLSFTAKFRLGNYSSPVLTYEYSTDNGSTWSETLVNGTCTENSDCEITVTDQSGTKAVLSYGATYQLKIKVTNADGTSNPSGAYPVYFINEPAAPSLTNVVAGSGSLTVSYVPGADGGATVTSIEYSTDGGTSWRNANCGACGSATTLLITTTSTGSALVSGTQYSIQLRAKNRIGTSVASNTMTATSGAVPGAPVLSSAVGELDSIAVSATLGAANGATVFDVEYSTDNGSTWRSSGQATGAFRITVVSNGGTELVGGTAYTVRVRARSAIGVGAASAGKTATPIDTPMPPALDSAVASGSGIAVRLSPGLLLGGTLLRYEYTTDGGVSWANTGQTSGSFVITAASVDRKALVAGTAYTVGIRTVTGAGASSSSNTISVVVGKVPMPPMIGSVALAGNGITVAGTYGSDNGSAVIRLEYSTDSGKTWATAGASAGGSTSTSTSTSTSGSSSGVSNTGTFTFTITALSADGSTPVEPSRSYVVSVRAVNVIGAGAASAPRSTVAGRTPSAPVITAATAGNTGIRIEAGLGSGNGNDIVDVEYSTDGGKTWASSGQKTGSFTISAISADGQTGLSGDTAYEVKIRGVNVIGSGAASNSITATTYGRANKIIIEKVADKLVSAAPFAIKARSSSKTPVTFASTTPESCDVEDGKVVLYEVGKCTLIASSVGGGVYPAGSETVSFNILPVPVSQAGVAISVRELSAKAGKPIPPKAKLVLKNLTPGVCMLKKQQVVGVADGRCIIQVKYGQKAAYRVGTTIGA
jgi:hypothetical protein